MNSSSKALGYAFAAPIVGAALGVILGLAIFDIFNSLEIWTLLILSTLLGASIWFGSLQAGIAGADPTLKAARGAKVLNYVTGIVWVVISFSISLASGAGAVSSARRFPNQPEQFDRDYVYNPGEYETVIELGTILMEFLPALLLAIISVFGFVIQLIAASGSKK